jgi:mannan endo-1,4-beta-mannosidase
VASLLEAVETTGTSGALIWSVRPRSRDGGFYWHSEPAGGNKFKAYHWPGFASGADYDERGVLALLQEKAYAIRGLAVPKLTKPLAPKLLPVKDAAAIYWQGTVGAAAYQVERAPSSKGPWTIAGDDIDETAVQYRPLFADTTAKSGSWYYRVRAKNEAGSSPHSNVEGPVKVTRATLVDELVDMSLVHAKEGLLTLETRDCRKAKEDAHRVKGEAGSYLIYRLGGLLQSYRVYVFSPGKSGGLRFSLSEDGIHFNPAQANEQGFYSGAGDYGYWAPILFSSTLENRKDKFLKIEFAAEAQIGRVEISYSVPN